MSFIITTSCNEGGYITPSGEIEIIKGGTQTFEFSFDVGYGASKLLIDGVEQEITDCYTFENVESNHTIELISEPKYFTITSSSSEGGTIYPPENVNVQQGYSQTFNFFPNENYEVSKVLIDDVEVDNKTAYTFNNVNDNHSISVEYVYIPKIFEINVISSSGGKLNPEKTIKVTEGNNQIFTIIPDNKYELESLCVDDEIVEITNNEYIFENVLDNHSIFAKFKYVPSYYTISASCNDGGKISNIGERSYIEYSSIDYTFTPNHKYKVKNVIIDNISYGSIEKYTFSDLSSNHTIDVEFEYVPDVFTVETFCGENGIVSQNGKIEVIEDTTFSLNIQPDTGYKISEIVVDGEIVEISNSVSINNIWENHTISVSFEPKMIYTITSSRDDNSKIYPLGEVNVYEDDNQKFEISANSGYFLKGVQVDGLDVEYDLLKTNYTFENVSENHTISVQTEKIEQEYHICSIASNYGNIEPNGVTSYEFGDKATYTFTPMSGYKLNNIIVDGKVIKLSSNTYTFYNIRGNHTITANFVIDVRENTIDEIDGLSMSLNYDAYNNVEASKIYLSKPNKRLLGVLNGVDEQSCNLSLKANNTHTISFDVYKEINGEETNYYNQIDVLMELYVSSIGWFKITQPPDINFDGNVEKITVNAESYEIELQQYDKLGFVVNKASEDSLEMMATDNTYLDVNGYKLFRDNVHFYRDISDYETLLNEFKAYETDNQTLENLKTLLIDNPTFLMSSWRFGIDIKAFMENLPAIKSSLSKDNYEIDYLDELQELYGVKDSSTGETALTTSVIKNLLNTHSELIEYLPLDINTQNINVKNKIFNNNAVSSNGDFAATLNVTGAYCVQGSEINFKVDVNGNKGTLKYKYTFGNDSNCITDYISQNSIDWTSYYDITSSENYITIPVSVNVVDTYTDEEGNEQSQNLTVTASVYVFTDKDTLSNYLIDNDIAITYEEYETYSLVELIELEMQRMKDLSLLDQILLECPSWKVGIVDKYVDEEFPEPLCDEVGAFEIDSQDIYSLLTQTMAQYFSCIFVFDTINMEVNAYRISGIGKDTNIHLGYRNVQNSIQITPTDELYTIFNVSNSDGLNLAYVNFGDREIEDISYFLNEEYLDSVLIDKYNAWTEYRESFRDEYIDYSRLYNSQNEVVTELYNRVPVDGLDIKQYEDFSYNELDEELNNYIALIEGIKSSFKLYVGGSEYEDITIVASRNPYISYQYYGLKENLEEIQKSIYWNEYRQYKEIVNNLLISMYNFDKDEEDDNYCDYLDDWQWDMVTYGYMYGLDELKAKLEVFKNGIETYKDYSTSYDNSNQNIIETTYNLKREEYLKYKDSYDKCIIMLKERELEISIAESILNEYYEKRNEIAQKVKKSNWKSDEYPLGFTKEDMDKLGRLYKSTDYINENIIYTSLSSTDDIIDKAYELYEDAVDNLYANSHPRLTYSTNQDNILAMIDYSDYINDFSLFNFIRISIRDDYQVKLRVIEYSLNPMTHDNNLNLVFSNMIQYKSKRNDFAALLDNAISTAKNQISSLTKSTSKNNEFSFDYDLVKSLLNSKSFGSYMSSYTANSVSSEALESALSNLGSISPNSAFIQYLNSNLLVTNDAYMDYLNSNLVVSNVADIRNLMFGSATGTTLQSKFSSSVISLLEDATIKSAMIESLNASKINAGTINTNYVEISSDSGNMKIIDNTIQIKDDNNVTRVQIGKDATNDYNMYVLDENGKVMFDATGLHEDGIKNGIIRDDMVSDNANISGSKLNIQSLYSSMNDSGYSLNASNVKLDAENQNLEVSFNTLNSKVIQQGNSLSSYGTKLSILQGQINSKIWKTDIDELVAENETIYNLTNQFSEFEQEYDRFTTTVSETYATIEDLDNINVDVGVRNLILNSNDIKEGTVDEFEFETSIPIKANTEYTFTIRGFANNNDTANGGFGLYFGNNLVEDNILCRTESETTIFTITSPSVITDEYHIIIKNIPSDTVIDSKIEWICMYEGDVSASDSWLPAPEDSITTSKQAMTIATQTANDFNWMVTKDEDTSELKLTENGINMISKHIEIDGTVSFGTFDSATQDMLSSQIEANTNMILKLYNGNENPSYTPSTLKLNAYKGYADDRVEYSGRFKIEEFYDGNWNVIQDITTTSSTSFELKLSDIINSSSTQLRCSVYTDEETPILIDGITLDIVDDFSSMLSVQNNKTYVDGGNVYCANLDADAILSNNITFTGTITGGDVDGGGIIKSFNYVVDTSGLKINLHDGVIDSKNFKVSSDGMLTCENANIQGSITADDGSIGGWEIADDSIYTTKSGMSSSVNKYAFWAGETNNYQGANGSNAKCYIKHDGTLYAEGATVKGRIEATELIIGGDSFDPDNFSGSGGDVDLSNCLQINCPIGSFGVTSSGSMYTGFKVSASGKMTCSNAEIYGTLKSSVVEACKLKSCKLDISSSIDFINVNNSNLMGSIFIYADEYGDNCLGFGSCCLDNNNIVNHIENSKFRLYGGYYSYLNASEVFQITAGNTEFGSNGEIIISTLIKTMGNDLGRVEISTGRLNLSGYEYINLDGDVAINGSYLGNAAFKNYTTSVTSGSSSLVTSGAVYSALSGNITSSGTITASTRISTGGSYEMSASYSTAVALFCKWRDGSNHNLAYRESDGLSAYFGWNGSSSYKTTATLRGYTVNLACGGNGGTSANKFLINFETDSESKAYLRPSTTGVTYLGSASYRWNTMFTNGSVNTGSDRRFKHDIDYNRTDEMINLIYNLKPTSYIYNHDEKNIKCYGFIAQDVRDYLLENDKSIFAGLTVHKKQEYESNIDILENLDTDEKYVEYGMAKEELIAPIVATIQRQKEEINELKELVNKLLETI